MELVRKVEAKLADLYKGAPKLSNNVQETLVNIMPWLTLIGGLLQLFAAWALYRWARFASGLNSGLNDFYRSIGVESPVDDRWTLWVWLGLIVLVVNAVILLMAFPKLKNRERGGWDLLFLGVLINVVYAVVSLFIEGRGFGSFLISLLGSAIAFWLLFAVKERYNGSAPRSQRTPPHVQNEDKE